MLRGEILEKLCTISKTEEKAKELFDSLLLDNTRLNEAALYLILFNKSNKKEDETIQLQDLNKSNTELQSEFVDSEVEVRSSVEEVIKSRDAYMKNFLEKMKGKRFIQTLLNTLSGDCSDIREIQIALTSIITHQLLDRELDISTLQELGLIDKTLQVLLAFTNNTISTVDVQNYLNFLFYNKQ